MKPDGGNAFPVREEKVGGSTYQNAAPGITVRDYFAAKALTAFAGIYQGDLKCAAQKAYAVADAMIAERSKP